MDFHPIFARSPSIRPFHVDLSPSRMHELITNTHLPEREEYSGLGDSFGIDLAYLRSLQHTWISKETYDWREEERSINK